MANNGPEEGKVPVVFKVDDGQEVPPRSLPMDIPGQSKAKSFPVQFTDEDDNAEDVDGDVATMAMSITSRGALRFGFARSQSPDGITKGSFERVKVSEQFLCGSPPGKNNGYKKSGY